MLSNVLIQTFYAEATDFSIGRVRVRSLTFRLCVRACVCVRACMMVVYVHVPIGRVGVRVRGRVRVSACGCCRMCSSRLTFPSVGRG